MMKKTFVIIFIILSLIFLIKIMGLLLGIISFFILLFTPYTIFYGKNKKN